LRYTVTASAVANSSSDWRSIWVALALTKTRPMFRSPLPGWGLGFFRGGISEEGGVSAGWCCELKGASAAGLSFRLLLLPPPPPLLLLLLLLGTSVC
jgi:hypothetical protein